MFRGSLAGCCLSAILLLVGCGVGDDVLVLRVGHSLDTGHPVHKAMAFMDQRLRELSGDTARIELYPSGQLGNEREMIELLQIGSLDMAKVSASPLEAFVPEMQVFNIPYIFRDSAHYRAVLDGPVGRQLLAAPVNVRLKGLGYYDAGSRSFYSSSEPITNPDALAGMKIRVQESATAMRMVSALGGSPTPIAWGELYTALQQGVVDGAENNPPSFYLSGHYEVSRFFVLDEHTSVPDVLLIGVGRWQQLTEQQQQWLQRAVADSVDYQRDLWDAETERALSAVQSAGVEVIYPDKTPFMLRVAALHAEYEDSPVGELLTQIASVAVDAE